MRFLQIFTLVLGACCSVAQAAPENKDRIPVEITADGDNRFEGGIAIASGNVVVRYGDDVIYADQISYDTKTKEIICRGNVRIFAADKIYRGELISYNMETKAVRSEDFRTAGDRLYAAGAEVQTPNPNHIFIKDGVFTTDNRDHPAYRLEATTIDIYPNDRVVLKNVVVKAGDVPIFWLPAVSQSLHSQNDTYDFAIGSSSPLGVYFIGSYNGAVNDKLDAGAYLGYYSRRGAGGGVNFDYKPKPNQSMSFKTFNIYDNGTDINVNGSTRPTAPDSERYRYTYNHKMDFGSDFQTTADLNILSDDYVDEDFFTDNFRNDVQPDNYADFMYYNENFTITTLVRQQFNHNFNVLEREPDFTLDIKRQKFFNTPLTYVGQSGLTSFQQTYDRNDPNKAFLPTLGADRWQSFNQLMYPQQYFNFLNFNPLAGFQAVAYDFHSRNPAAAPGAPNQTGSLTRAIINTGFESSFKISRVWDDANDESMGVTGIRHMAEPFMNYSYIPDLGNEPDTFRGFDSQIPNLRPVSLSYPLYNSIDSITNTNYFRTGVRNKIQTKRDGENVDLADWVIFTDIDIDRDQTYGTYTRQGFSNGIVSEIYNEVGLAPLPWIRYDLYSALPTASKGWWQIDSAVTWQVAAPVDIKLGQRWLSDPPTVYDETQGVGAAGLRPLVEETNLLTVGSFWRLNENWQFEQSLDFEMDDGTLQEQRYSIYRDLTAWNAALTAAYRQNQSLPDEFVLYFSLTLKAFPKATIDVSN